MFYANKTKREELSTLSMKVFGTRNKWKYFVTERGYSIELIETNMLQLSKQIDEVINEQGKLPGPTIKQPSRKTKRNYGIKQRGS